MCGIVGLLVASARGVTEERVGRFRRRLAMLDHRGPDNRDYHRIGEKLLLGHNRLAIIDPTHANDQPFVGDDTILIFNGEIFNFPDLREELKGRGMRFRTAGDSEVISAGYAVWGTEIFKRLKGMYAIAIWDKRDGTLHLARDAFGIKPLYVCDRGGELQFASEIKAIETEVGIDPTGFADLASFGAPFGPATLYSGIEAVEPGWRHSYRVVSGEITCTRSADKPLADLAYRRPPSRDLGDMLRKSVADHLISDVPLASTLSGGLDSSVITAAAAARNPNLKAYTNTLFPDGDAETQHAAIVSRHLGIEQKTIFSHVEDFEATLRQICYFVEEPLINSAIFNSWFLAKAIRADGFKVALVGEGSDEIFAGYPWHALGLEDADLATVFGKLRERRAVSLEPPSFLSAAMRAAFAERLREQEAIFEREMSGPRGDRFNDFLLFDVRHQLRSYHLQRIDRLFMAFGVEARVPYLYDDVIQCAFALAPWRRLDVSEHWLARLRRRFRPPLRTEKACLAEAFAGDLPREILARPKFGKGGTVNLSLAPSLKGWPALTKAITTAPRYAEARDLLGPHVDWKTAAAAKLPRKEQMFLSMLTLGTDAMLNGANETWRETVLGSAAAPLAAAEATAGARHLA